MLLPDDFESSASVGQQIDSGRSVLRPEFKLTPDEHRLLRAVLITSVFPPAALYAVSLCLTTMTCRGWLRLAALAWSFTVCLFFLLLVLQ